MAHEQQRPRELDEQLLEQVERLDVEVVRRLVEHEQVERRVNSRASSSRLRSPPDSARDRRARAIGAKEKVLRGSRARACARRRPATKSAPSATLSNTLRSGSSCSRSWSKYAISSPVPRRIVPASGVELAEQQTEQRRLAGAVRADQADAVAAHDRRREVAHDRALAAREAHVARLDDEPPRALGLLRLQLHRCRRARAARSARRAAPRARARALRCACAAPGFPCGSTPLPSRASCRTPPTRFASACERGFLALAGSVS